jgi:hypothetical protein
MLPLVPHDLVVGGLELVCYGCTMVAALFSYLFLWR